MFNVSLSDRLKAAVNQLEATGTSLQARAQAGLQAQNSVIPAGTGSGAHSGRGETDATTTRGTGPGGVDAPKRLSGEGNAGPESPSRGGSGAFSPTHLAEGALSGLRGIRGSFNFSRTSLDGQRPSSTALSEKLDGSVPRELKDIPSQSPSPSTNQDAGPSRTTSPGPARSVPTFQLGTASDPSSVSPTPFAPRSPGPGPGPSHLRQHMASPLPAPSPLEFDHTPNPDDPASYPLPPSPTLSPTPLLQSSPLYADPLGASPLITPAESLAVPHIAMDVSTPEVERQADELLREEGLEVDASLSGNAGSAGNAEDDGGGGDMPNTHSAAEAGTDVEVTEAAEMKAVHGGGSEGQEVSASGSDGAAESSPLQAQILAADKILRELTPLEGGIADAGALEGWVRMMKSKVELSAEEMKRLQDKLALQESRIEELRDTHRLEGSSQTDLITKLRSQLSTAETNLASKLSDLSALPGLRSDLAKAQTQIKEEEEKRTKAISLLKTVRMKLVKAEKDKEEVERDRAEERAERSRAMEEVERVKAEREREVTRLRQGFEREIQGVKERAEREMKEKRGAWELEMITTKASHAKELTSKTTMVAGLEGIVKELSTTKDEQFHTIQARQAEAETARAESETLQSRTKELEFQLREANERIALLEDAARTPGRGRNSILNGDNRFSSSPSPSPSRQNSSGTSGTSASEVQRLLAEAEARAEAKMSDLRFRIRSLEKERNDQEEEFGQKLQERVSEVERVKRVMQERDGEVAEADRRVDEERQRTEAEVGKRQVVEKELKGVYAKLEEAKEDVATAQDGERIAKDEISQMKLTLHTLSVQLEEQKQLVATLRQANKTLRDELRKVQSSVQLMERSRNPGVGYWSSAQNAPSGSSTGTASSTTASGQARNGDVVAHTPASASSSSGRTSIDGGKAGPAPSDLSGAQKATVNGNEEEEVNLEYLRNVILQFLENPQMRRQLVQVLSVILHFTPQELRRLNAKIMA